MSKAQWLPRENICNECLTSRSVHNTRIERLWYDVTQGFGMKWKTFFLLLETSNDLDVHRVDHLWLLHHLFLACVNEDAQEWARMWNNHKMQLSGESNKSPREMMFFGTIEQGIRGAAPHHWQGGVPQEDVVGNEGDPILSILNRGVEIGATVEGDFHGQHVVVVDEDVENLAEYGVDWEDLDNLTQMQHHLANNVDELQWTDSNPLAPPGMPTRLSNVPCESPSIGCPLTEEEVATLERELQDRDIFRHELRSMELRRLVWNEALDIYYTILEQRHTDTE